MNLFMIELKVANTPRACAWYAGVLGLGLLLDDPAGDFALLEAGSGRIALKGGGDASPGRDVARLIFEVDDVDAERARLHALGVPLGAPIDNRAEGYREVRLHDLDGTPIRLFSRTRSAPTAPEPAADASPR